MLVGSKDNVQIIQANVQCMKRFIQWAKAVVKKCYSSKNRNCVHLRGIEKDMEKKINSGYMQKHSKSGRKVFQ